MLARPYKLDRTSRIGEGGLNAFNGSFPNAFSQTLTVADTASSLYVSLFLPHVGLRMRMSTHLAKRMLVWEEKNASVKNTPYILSSLVFPTVCIERMLNCNATPNLF